MMRDGAGGRRAGTYPEVYSGPDHCSGTYAVLSIIIRILLY
jgi:hypothetical protein